MAAKDFGPIESDYAFFMASSTEPANDAAEYVRELATFDAQRPSIGLLDFGCGAGDFTQRLLSMLNWPPQALRITLVEPVQHHREQAARRLAGFSRHPIVARESLPTVAQTRFDVILSNHALYYVGDLGATLGQMLDLLAPGGQMLLAIAGWDNALLQLWKVGFALLDRPVPYYAAEDVEAILSQRSAALRQSETRYELRFTDSRENRLKILRFLFAEHLPAIGPERLLGEFDRYVRSEHVEVDTTCTHFAVERAMR